MLSNRLDKRGKDIPSMRKPDDLNSGHSYGGSNYPTNQQHHPYASGYDFSSREWDELDEEAWRAARERMDAKERASQAVTVLSGTSLGSPPREKDQDTLNQFLTQHSKWAVSDFITFDSYPIKGAMVSVNSISLILKVERGINDVKWHNKYSNPEPFMILSLWPCFNENHGESRARWSDLVHHRHLAQVEFTEFIKNNVQLSNYIQQAKDSLKAGTLKIEN